MENQVAEKCAMTEDGSNLNRNRSCKSKQLVRSQAIRESASPPRTVSPSVRSETDKVAKSVNANKVNVKVTALETNGSDSSHDSDVLNYSDKKDVRKPVEIQITQEAWDESPPYEDSGCSKRWPSEGSRESTRDLLSNNPRVACVCGACAHCPHCRGLRRRHICTIKQDSGICPDECPECSDVETNGANNDVRKTSSLDADDHYYCRCPERKDKPKGISRTDSDDKLEPTGPELVTFIKDTLNKNIKDRMTLLKIEKELHSLINDTGRCIVKFPVMTSYGRMLVHRCASLFQLSHTLDQSNKTCVVVSKSGTSGGRIPCTSFKTWCYVNFPPPSPQRNPPEPAIVDGANAKSILKRDTHSLDEPSAGALAMNRSKSLEQREKEYEQVRRRIFSSGNQDESQWPWINTGPVKLLTPDPGRNKLLKVQSLENSVPPQNWRGRGGPVSKSHSFGGYGEPPPPSRALSRQGDLASSSWRLSPSSSGYKTLSLRSTDSVTPSPTGGGTPEPALSYGAASVAGGAACRGPVVWAVTDMDCVPTGALVIHPQTGRPLTNADGSVYHFDPSNPPVLYDPDEYQEIEPTKVIDQNNEKRRGRLEKQHSFIDHEAEYQQTEQYHYEYERYEVHEQHENPTQKDTPKLASAMKNCYNPNQNQEFSPEPLESTNQAEAQPEATNQRDLKAGIYQDTVYYGPYANLNQAYCEEVQSPPQMGQFLQPDMTNLQNMMSDAKVAPILQDPNFRPMSLTNVVYPANVPPGYQFIPNQCRIDPSQQQLYQSMLQQQQIEEQKIQSPPQQPAETTFRIDSSYPYAPVDYTAAYVDPTPIQTQPQPQPQRSYSVPYNPAELAAIPNAMPPVYPLGSVIPPQLIQYPVQYQEPLQWAPLQAPQAMCPVVYPQHYAHYNFVYPQVLPQPYPICQPIYTVLNRKRNSLPSSRATPITTPEEKPYEKYDRQNAEVAAKINQIKQGMMNLKRDDYNKRNSGNGILGSGPVNSFNGVIAGGYENVQLSTTARAIFNTIRQMQANNTYHQDSRYEYNNYPRYHERSDYRRRYEDRREINGRGDGNTVDRHTSHYVKNNYNDKSGNAQDRSSNNPDRNSNNTENNSNYQDRGYAPYRHNSYQDKSFSQGSNAQDRSNNYGQDYSNNQDKTNNTQCASPDKTVQEKQNSVQERQSNVQDISVQGSNVLDKAIQSNAQDRTIQSTVQDRSIQSNLQDMTIQNNAQDRTIQSNVQDRTVENNVQERKLQSNAQDRTHERSVPDRSNYQDRNNGQERNYQNRGYYQDRGNYHDRGNTQVRPWQDRRYGPRHQGVNQGQFQYRPQYIFRQMNPGTWCRRSPAPFHPGINHNRRPHPDNRNGHRY